MSATTEALKDAALRLATSREEVAQRAADLKAKRDAFDAEHAAQIAALAAAKDAAANTEAEVRALALVAHDHTQDTKPCPGVSIVFTKQYDINEDEGFTWAQMTGLCLQPAQLDVKAIKAMASKVALPFVKVREEPSVRIAIDLLAALDGAK